MTNPEERTNRRQVSIQLRISRFMGTQTIWSVIQHACAEVVQDLQNAQEQGFVDWASRCWTKNLEWKSKTPGSWTWFCPKARPYLSIMGYCFLMLEPPLTHLICLTQLFPKKNSLFSRDEKQRLNIIEIFSPFICDSSHLNATSQPSYQKTQFLDLQN